MVPFFVFYSMFGLQRIGDLVWAAGDMRCRGFLIGGTAGRTTLNGEGLQHQDGNSHILALPNPSLLAYDPAFAFEIAVIVREGLRRMLEEVVRPGGTGTKAAIEGYRVAGKTGTVKKFGPNGYSDDRYLSLFAGMAPAGNPRVAMVVMLNEPRGGVFRHVNLLVPPKDPRAQIGWIIMEPADTPPMSGSNSRSTRQNRCSSRRSNIAP